MQNDEYQSYIALQEMPLEMNAFDQNEPTLDGADYILGLGNKNKKAAKKIRKAEKAFKKGDIKRAERKLDKANKKLPTETIYQKTKDVQAKIDAKLHQDPTPIPPTPKPLDGGGLMNPLTPTTQDLQAKTGDATGSIGSIASGDNSPAFETPNPPGDLTQDNSSTLPNVNVVASRKSKLLPVIIAVVAVAVILFFVLKRKK